MTRKVWRVRGAVPLVLAGVLGACGGDAEAVDAAPRATDGFTRVINVEVEPVATSDFTEVIRLTGTVLANRDVVVSAEEAGVITRILVDQGRSVWQGQPIARIDDRILISQVDQARAQAALAVETWERRKRLYEEDQVGSELSYLEAKYGAEQAQANLAALEQRLERTSIKAPFSGVLDSRNIELGSMVMPGSPVARIVDLDPVKIRGGVPERFALDVKRGSQATVSFQVLDDQIFEGDITYVGAAVDPRDRTFPVELTLPNPGGLIKPEMVANIEVVRRQFSDVIVVPQEALVRVEDGFVAFVVEGTAGAEGGVVARVRRVELGATQRNQVVIDAGLEVGERLIVIGQQQVASGDRVRVVN